MKTPIVFLNAAHAGRRGFMDVDESSHTVMSITFDDGTTVPDNPGYSYRTADVDAEIKAKEATPVLEPEQPGELNA